MMSAAVRRVPLACAALVLMMTLAACNDDPAEDPTPGASSPPEITEAAETAEGAETAEAADPTPSTNADADCLVAGSPWEVSTTDLESQFAGVLSGIDVIDVAISGGQTLTVGLDLVARFTPNRTTRVRIDLGQGLTMVMVQRQTGSATGQWQLGDGKLTSTEPWSGNLHATTTVTINGRSGGNAPFDLPVGGLADVAVTFSCESGALMMQAEGSPFSYLFH